jgi:hypothetical protein
MLQSSYRRLSPRLRGAALMPTAALGVHRLRYELAYGAHASHALSAQGHAYLSPLMPWTVLLAAFAVGGSLGALTQRWASGRGGIARRGAGVRAWLLASAALLAIYAGQELLEGCFAGGHAGGVAAVLGGGGWWALPAALVVGGLLALALRTAAAAERALAELARVRLRARPVRHERSRSIAPASPRLPALAPLASAAAGRAPPRLLVALPA